MKQFKHATMGSGLVACGHPNYVSIHRNFFLDWEFGGAEHDSDKWDVRANLHNGDSLRRNMAACTMRLPHGTWEPTQRSIWQQRGGISAGAEKRLQHYGLAACAV